MIQAFQKDEELLADIRSTKDKSHGIRLWWLGQSGFLVQWQGKYLLIDPYLSDSLTKKYAETDKQHIRMSEKVIDPSKLDFIDVVTSSHNHTDHLDGDTLIPLIKANPNVDFVIPRANLDFVLDRVKLQSSMPICLNAEEEFELDCGIKVRGVLAAHNEVEIDAAGNHKYMGYVFTLGDYSIYHSGDTLWQDAIVEGLKNIDIDIALLPINGNKPERRLAGNLNETEAVAMAKAIGAKLLIPCHYHMFTFNTVDPDAFIRVAEKEKQVYKVLQVGEGVNYV